MPLVLLLLVILPWLAPRFDLVRLVLAPPVLWLGGQFLALASLVAGHPIS
jgi:hypothetical protein